MNTIKIRLSTSGRVASLDKNFPLYCGQFQNVLLNILVPTEILAPDFAIQHYIGNYSNTYTTTNPDLQTALDNFVVEHTYDPETHTGRQPVAGDVIFYTRTTNDKYYRAVYGGTAWTFTEVPYFAMGNFAGTNVKVGVIATESNGTQYKSKSYYCRYVKTLTNSQDGIQYALYERKMPREFTATIGSGQAARTVIINVVNATQDKVENIVTSQTVGLDVLPSTALDEDEPIDATAQEELWEAINGVAEELSEKQDKKDAALSIPASVQDPAERTVVGAINDLESRKQDKVDTTIHYDEQTTVVGAINALGENKQEKTDNSLLTNSKNIVGAINEVKGTADAANAQATENKADIDDLKPRMTAVESVAGQANARSIQNASDIAALEAIVGSGEDFIGTLTINYDPTQNQAAIANDLNAFVLAQVGRTPKGGDSVIVVEEVSGGTDRNFKYIYTGTAWEGYEIPPVELASNGTAGLVSGTYNVGSSNNTIVSIVGGEIQNIYVKDGANYRDIRDILLANKEAIANIIDGTTVVKEAESATKDSAGNNIANSFAALVSGATKVGAAAQADEATKATNDGLGNSIAAQFSNILDGTTPVELARRAGEALRATQDSLGNNIVSTYLTATVGATKAYVQDYALPKQFNNALYLRLTNDTYHYLRPSSIYPATATTSSVGETQLLSAYYELGTGMTGGDDVEGVTFELSRKNSISARYFIEASGYAGTRVQFKLTAYATKDGESPTLLFAQLLPEQDIPTTLAAIDFSATMSELEDTVLSLTTGDKITLVLSAVMSVSSEVEFDIYSNDTYPSVMNLNTQAQTITYNMAEIGQTIFVTSSSIDIISNTHFIIRTNNADLNRAIQAGVDANITLQFSVPVTAAQYVIDSTMIYLSVNNTNIPLTTAKNAVATFGDIKAWKRSDGTYALWGTCHGGSYILDVPNIDTKDKTAKETKQVAANDWSATANISPFAYSYTTTILQSNTDFEKVTLIASPIVLAKYGIVIGTISGTNITFYAQELPAEAVDLTLLFEIEYDASANIATDQYGTPLTDQNGVQLYLN